LPEQRGLAGLAWAPQEEGLQAWRGES